MVLLASTLLLLLLIRSRDKKGPLSLEFTCVFCPQFSWSIEAAAMQIDSLLNHESAVPKQVRYKHYVELSFAVLHHHATHRV